MITQWPKKEFLKIYQSAFDYEFKNLTKKEKFILKGVFASAIIIVDTLWTDESKKFYVNDETGERGLID